MNQGASYPPSKKGWGARDPQPRTYSNNRPGFQQPPPNQYFDD